MRGDFMEKLIRKKLDVNNLPPLSKEDNEMLIQLANLPDEEIDFSDIPLTTTESWKNAKPNPLFKIKKQIVSSRIDVDVLSWLKSYGKGYQQVMNNILRRMMLEEKAKKAQFSI